VTWSAFARSSLCVAGALLLMIGLGNAVVGRTKIGQYQALLRQAPPPPAPRDPEHLFPVVDEAQERRAVAIAKLGYYQLLFAVGQALSATGVVLLAIGVLRVRIRAARNPLTS